MATVDEIAAQLQTNNQARRALGITADYLRRAYALVPRLGSLSQSVFNLYDDDDLQQQATDLLDRTNAYAQGIYAVLPANDAPIRADLVPKVETALRQAESSFRLLVGVDADLSEDFLDSVLDAIGKGIGAVAGSVASAALAQWPVVLCIVAAVWLFARYRK